jgi:phosphinothricin acetyltransferase
VGVGFDAEDAVAVVEEELGEEASAGADVDDDGGGGECVEGFEVFEEGFGVGGAVLDVIVDAGREALGGVGGRHGGMIARVVVQGGVMMKIRVATADDLGVINAIYNHYVGTSTCTYQEEATSAGERETWLAAHGARHPVIVALQGAAVVGWGSLGAFHGRSGWRMTVEDSVYVHPGHLRKGIGRLLLRELKTRARMLGYWQVVAVISADQEASVALHKSEGFVEAGVLKGVGLKFGRVLDVVYMQWGTGATPT